MPTVRLYTPQVDTRPVGGVDLEPLGRALDGLVGVMARQREADRRVRFREITGRASLELRRQALELSSDGDPDTRAERFTKLKDRISEGALKELDESGIGGGELFRLEYEQSALSEEFQLRKAATAEMAKMTEARMEVALDHASRMAGEGSAEQQAQWKKSGQDSIWEAVEKGAIDPAEGVKRIQKFNSDIVTAQVRRDIYARPHDAEQALLGDGYQDLSPEARIQWLERASSKAEALERRALADEERAHRMAERHDKAVADRLQKQGDQFLAEGSMTPEWLEFHRDDLSAGDYRYFYEALTRKAEKAAEGPKVKTDPHVYSDLMGFAGDGQDVRQPAREAYLDQQITREDYDRILSRVESEQSGGGRKSPAQKQAEEYISNFFGSQADMDPTAAARKAQALDEMYNWSRTHQDATPEDFNKAKDSIVRSYSLLQLQDSAMLLPTPRNFVGTRTAPDLAATENGLMAEFEARHHGDQEAMLNDPDFQAQAALLVKWQQAVAAADAPKGEAAP